MLLALPYLSRSRVARWGAPFDLKNIFFFFSRNKMFASRPVHFFFNVIIPSFSLSTSTPLSLHCVLQDSLGNSRWSCDVTISLHFASFYLSYEIFTRPGGVSNSGLHYLVGYVISIKDTKEFAETSHPQCLYPSLNFSCYCPRFRCIIYNNVIWLWSII